ncbi:uncharacterized protein sS8_3524 [Methylocaldum marinum]|uniref:UbiA prenyltransferase n=1 Tax=Methylocaldum marinum TaxID=1432792 RepID=A0A250KWX5_9GAMM|nr:UbiA family prenyltransferase [Methylocaldum marinum]BBA35461.1 uncharacterized protein sS8_3524 [Methylocaldum marinum]
MKAIRSYLDLCRVSNLPTVWTNALAASLLATGAVPASFLLPVLANSCFYMAGMSLNDLCDAKHDRTHRPTRPIPSGRVSERAALIVTVMLFGAGLLLLAAAPHASGLVAGLMLVLAIVAYDFRHKRNPLSVLLMAACRFLVFAVTSLALTDRLPPLVLLGGGIQFFYVVLISLVARRENARSTPFSFPVIPGMLAGIALLDGILMALSVALPWLLAGIAGSLLTWAGQRFVRGD